MTYDELLSTVTSYTLRDDAPVQGFIKRAESYLRTVTRHYLSEKTVVLSVVDRVAELPADYLEMRVLTGTKIYKPVAPMAAKLAEDECGYYREGNTIVFVGEPDAEVAMLYHAAFPDLTPTQTNWLFDRFANTYLAAILKEFHRWQVNPEGVAIEDAALKECLSIIAESDRRGRLTGPIIMAGSSSWQ